MFSSAGKAPSQQERDEQKRNPRARTAWRLSVPMTYFEALRSQFDQRGLTIRAYAAPFGCGLSQMRADPNLGDLTKTGVSALDFVKSNLANISSIDLKDATEGRYK